MILELCYSYHGQSETTALICEMSAVGEEKIMKTGSARHSRLWRRCPAHSSGSWFLERGVCVQIRLVRGRIVEIYIPQPKLGT